MAEPEAGGAEKQLKVLAVDDDQTMGELVQDYIKSWRPCAVDYTGNGSDAWTKIEATPYDLIVLDWRLPGTTGFVLFNRLRTLPNCENTPVLISSGLLDGADARLMNEYPCTRLAAKPYTKEVFTEAIQALMAEWDWYQRNKAAVKKIIDGIATNRAAGIAELQELLKSSNNPGPVAIVAARALRAQGDLGPSEALLRSIIKKEPQSTIALYELGKVLFQAKRFDEAMKVLEEAQRQSPKNFNRTRLMGEIELNRGDADAATKQFEQTLTLDPDDKKAKTGLELANIVKNEASDQNGRVTMSFASVMNMVAISLVKQGNHEEGIKRYTEAMEFLADAMDKGRICYNVGLAFVKWDKNSEARQWFEKAVELTQGKLDKAVQRLSKTAPAPSPTPAPEPDIEFTSDEVPKETPAAPPPAPPPEAPLEAAPAAASAPPAPAAEGPPIAVNFTVPEEAPDSEAIIKKVREAVERTKKEEAAFAKAADGIARLRIALYHPTPNGWQRAERQIQAFGCTATMGTNDVSVLLETLSVTKYSLLLAWFQGDDTDQALALIEDLLEDQELSRCGLLIHCPGEKPLIAFRTKGQGLLIDKISIVNWNRAKFEADVNGVLDAAKNKDAPLTKLLSLRSLIRSTKGPSPQVDAALADGMKAVSDPAASSWFAALQGEWLMAQGRRDEALAMAAKLGTSFPNSFTIKLLGAAIASEAGQISAPIELADWLKKSGKSSPQRVERIGQMLVRYGHQDSLRVLLDAWAAKFGLPVDARFFTLAGRFFLLARRYNEAGRCLATAIDKQPLKSQAVLAYAEALEGQRQYYQGAAIADLATSCLGTNLIQARVIQARCLAKDRKWKEAEACLDETLKLNPAAQDLINLKAAVGRREI